MQPANSTDNTQGLDELLSDMAGKEITMSKTPNQFRNDLYQYFVDNSVTEDTASRIAGEAELFATAFEVYQLQDIEVAARKMGFKPGGESSE